MIIAWRAVLASAVCAVVAGARSLVAVAEWVADLPDGLAVALGVDRRCPSESTIRRLLGKVGPGRFDVVLGGFVQRLYAVTTPAGSARWKARPCACDTRSHVVS